MKRRRPVVTLFAFQDIITAVTGIVILISLLLTLQLIAAPNDPNLLDITAAELNTAIAASEARLASTTTHLNELQAAMEEAAAAVPSAINRREADLLDQIESLEADLDRLENQQESLSESEAAAEQDLERVERLNAEIEQLRIARAAIEAELLRLQSGNRRYYRLEDMGGRQAWLVVCSGTRLSLAPVDVPLPPVQLEFSSRQGAAPSLQQWLAAQQIGTMHLVFLLRPSAAELFDELCGAADRAGVSYGYDLIGEDVQVLDPQRGAGIQ